jgi:hypothetical protein
MGMSSSARMSWHEICAHKKYRGRWVALDGCRFDNSTQQPSEGTVIDADDDLGELCSRVKRANHHFCTILYCENARHHSMTPPSRPTTRH